MITTNFLRLLFTTNYLCEDQLERKVNNEGKAWAWSAKHVYGKEGGVQ